MSRMPLLLAVAAASIVLFALADGAGAAPPQITVPADVTVEATSATGADITYTASAVNSGGHKVALACSAPAGAPAAAPFMATATFGLGSTTVVCTVTDPTTGAVESFASFTVTVTDKTPPTLTLPDPITVSADSATGVAVAYSASATDLVDGAVPVFCSPAAGTPFTVGTTSVSCTATDAHGNTASGGFTITVAGPQPGTTDTTPPVFSNVSTTLAVEATSPKGATVTYLLPTATDSVDGPIADVRCAPRSATVFSIGQTQVSCTASDSAGNTATVTFTVSVVDTTPPTLNVPTPITVSAPDTSGLAATNSTIAAFLTGARVQDIADPAPVVTTEAPKTFPVGSTTVTFTARDESGNTTRKSSNVTVLAPATVGQTPPAAMPTAPAGSTASTPPLVKPLPLDPTAFKATIGRGNISLRWTLPSFAGFDHVELLRAQASAGLQPTLLYRGRGNAYLDKTVKESELYRYQIVAVTADGDRSPGTALTAFAQPRRLLAPLDGAQLHGRPVLRWLPTSGATYYNLQLYRNGVKVLSLWPNRPSYAMPSQWSYHGHRFRLTDASYRWFVWAGYGSRAARTYGGLLGSASFSLSP
jgi:HYR domain